MPNFICVMCGNQYAATETPPPACPTCEDERQYVRPQGQAWTTIDEMRVGHSGTLFERRYQVEFTCSHS